MTSREKVMRLKSWLGTLAPEDEGSAQQLQILASLAPLLVKAIPDDPAELDNYLRTIAWAAAQCRSDEAPALGVFEAVDGGWQAVSVESS